MKADKAAEKAKNAGESDKTGGATGVDDSEMNVDEKFFAKNAHLRKFLSNYFEK